MSNGNLTFSGVFGDRLKKKQNNSYFSFVSSSDDKYNRRRIQD